MVITGAGKSSWGREAKAKTSEWVLSYRSSKFCWAIKCTVGECLYTLECYKMGWREDLVKRTCPYRGPRFGSQHSQGWFITIRTHALF